MNRIRTGLLLLAAALGLALAAPRAEAQAATHVVRSGETLFSIARQYGLTVDELRALNRLSGTTIQTGQRLVVRGSTRPAPAPLEAPGPVDPPDPPVRTGPAPAAPLPAQGRPILSDTGRGLQRGDPPDLVRPDPIPTGPPPPPPPPSTVNHFRIGLDAAQPFPMDAAGDAVHVVRSGETLYAVAQRYGVSVDALVDANGLRDERLRVGQTLTVPGGVAGPLSAPRGFAVNRTVVADDEVHVVRRGDTLFGIAARYGTTVGRLLAINQVRSGALAPGTVIYLPDGVGVRHYAEPAPPRAADDEGLALIYPASYVGRMTISREPYDPEALTASHRTLPFGTVLWVRARETGRETLVRINDRGPVSEGFLVELSEAAARELGLASGSAAPVEIRVLR